jgi:hypothetical protein
MKEQELKFKVENYIGFDDDGYLESMMFVGNGDKPIINEKFNMKDLIKEFIDVRSSNTGFDELCLKQRDLLIKNFEKSIEMLKKVA